MPGYKAIGLGAYSPVKETLVLEVVHCSVILLTLILEYAGGVGVRAVRPSDASNLQAIFRNNANL